MPRGGAGSRLPEHPGRSLLWLTQYNSGCDAAEPFQVAARGYFYSRTVRSVYNFEQCHYSTLSKKIW